MVGCRQFQNNENGTTNNYQKINTHIKYSNIPLQTLHLEEDSFESNGDIFKITVKVLNNSTDPSEQISIYKRSKLISSCRRTVKDTYSAYPILYKNEQDSSGIILMVNASEYTSYFSIYYFDNDSIKYLGDAHCELIAKYQESKLDYKDFSTIAKQGHKIAISILSKAIVSNNANLKKNDSLFYFFNIDSVYTTNIFNKKETSKLLKDILTNFETNDYKVLDSVSCDLDLDNVRDLLIIFQKNNETELTSLPFDYTKIKRVLLLLKGQLEPNKYLIISRNENIIKTLNPNCAIEDPYQRLVTNKSFFTVEQAFCSGNSFVNEYITFKYITYETILLHKYGTVRTDQSDIDKQIPSKVYTSKDFGRVDFSAFDIYNFDVSNY
jgi:hypothetical protein